MLRKKRGMAIIEFMFFFLVFIFFFAIMYGSWGITHSAILRSIGARAYAWDSIRSRSNLAFLNDYSDDEKILENNYSKEHINSRVFASIDNHNKHFMAKKLKIDMGGADWDDSSKPGGFVGVKFDDRIDGYSSSLDTFLDPDDRLDYRKRNEKDAGDDYRTGVVHLQMAYGICLNSNCDVL
ncbi:MAG: hypothetical protein OXK80_00260 [Bdellovibrionales bacterium]|nr:hypothetical protein [Bdellovibrionales bacterium]